MIIRPVPGSIPKMHIDQTLKYARLDVHFLYYNTAKNSLFL